MAIIGTKISSVSTSGEIVGISASEVAQVLGEPLIVDSVTGVTGDAVGYLAHSTKIKKWNIHKPVNRSLYQKLTDADFKGDSTDIANGIIYGLQAGISRTSPASLHNADWAYVGRPNGIYRNGDFDGYDHSIEAPTLSGAGLYSGQRIDYTTAQAVELVWAAKEGAIDLAEVFAAYQGTANYNNMYLCALVGTYARCCTNVTAGGVYPIVYNGVQCTKFSIPAVSSFLSYDNTRQVTLFFASATDVNTLVPALKTSWVNLSIAPAFNQPLVSVPNQVNLSVTFVRNVMEYISAFSLSVVSSGRGEAISVNLVKGGSWNSAYAYRIKWSATDADGNNIPTSFTSAVDKGVGNPFDGPPVFAIIGASALAGYRYNITGTMQVQTTSGGAWEDTTFSSTINIKY